MALSNGTYLRDFLEEGGVIATNTTACVDGELEVTYRELLEQIERLSAEYLSLGLRTGDRVCLLLENSARFVVAYLAILKCGGVVVPLNPSAPLPALREQIVDAGTSIIVCEGRRRLEIEEAFAQSRKTRKCPVLDSAQHVYLVPLGGSLSNMSEAGQGVTPAGTDPLAAIFYTSGTTGRPKGVMLSTRNLSAIAEAGAGFVALNDDDRVGVVTPLFHLYGMREIDACIRAGAALVIIKNLSFPAQALQHLHRAAVTGVSAVPSGMALFTQRYLSSLRACSEHLRYVTLGAIASSRALLTELRATLPDTRIFITYGMTEASRVSYQEVVDVGRYAGSVGRPYPGGEVWVVDEAGNRASPGVRGRVMVKSGMVMQGYWKQPNVTEKVLSEDGSLRTADYGWLDESGLLYLAGRIDNLINSGGEKIAPAEVEAVLLGHPAIADAAITGAPDPNGVMQEVVKACIVIREGEALDHETVKNFCSQQLESSKVPRIVEFCDALPKTVLGKTATGLLPREGSQEP